MAYERHAGNSGTLVGDSLPRPSIDGAAVLLAAAESIAPRRPNLAEAMVPVFLASVFVTTVDVARVVTALTPPVPRTRSSQGFTIGKGCDQQTMVRSTGGQLRCCRDAVRPCGVDKISQRQEFSTLLSPPTVKNWSFSKGKSIGDRGPNFPSPHGKLLKPPLSQLQRTIHKVCCQGRPRHAHSGLRHDAQRGHQTSCYPRTRHKISTICAYISPRTSNGPRHRRS